MSLSTFSTFYYNYEFDQYYKYINFKENGGSELTAEVEIGSYTPTEMATVIQDAMNTSGALTYQVTFNRSERTFTISLVGAGSFDLLISSGTSDAKAFSIFGFSGADRTSLSASTGNTCGNEYNPQFILQDYISTNDFQKLISPTINKSASGAVEVIRFGVEKFMQCNIKFITNKESGGDVIRYNPTGVANAQSFLQYLITKKPIEFMPDIGSRNTFQKMLLESTPDDQKGTGYKLKELYDKNLPGFYETGALIFRLIEV